MKKFALLSLFALFMATFANAQCGSNCLFYGGDFDVNNPNANGLANENDATVGGSPYGAAVYQNFIIPTGQVFFITSLFTNNASGLNPVNGYWEIRSGLPAGNGGTLIASGTASGSDFSQTATHRSRFGYNEYTDTVSFPDLDISSGTYWMAVVPNDPTNPHRSFNTNTFGLNKFGTQTSGMQFFNSPFFGPNFINTGLASSLGPQAWLNSIPPPTAATFATFSSGVRGTTALGGPSVPEPSSMIMFGSGLLAVAGVVRRRLSR